MEVMDIVILAVYMIGILLLGSLVGRKNSTGEDYFSGGRSMPWYAIGLSVGLTMISANSFIGGPGWAYFDGIVAAMVNITVPLSIFFVTYTILPVIYNAKVTTVYEYTYLRFGTRTRILNVLAWLAQSLIFVGGFVYTPSLVLAAITGIGMNVWIPIIVILAIIYTVAGGIKAVIWTDMIQGIILFIGLLAGVAVATGKLGMPLGQAVQIAREAGIMQSFDFSFNTSSLTFWCAIIAGFAMWAGYFGFDQGQVQRYVTAKNMRTIKKTGVMSSCAMQLIYWLCFFLGVILFVFYQSNPHTLDFANTNNVMTDFLLNYVPHGLLGVLLAATFAAAMSSIDSVLNSLTAVFTKDIYEPYITKKKDTPLYKSIIFSLVCGVLIIGFVYLYLGDNTASILQTIGAFVSPMGSLLTGIMICSLFIPSINDKGCFWGSVAAAIITFVIGKLTPGAYYLWAYAYGAGLCILFSWIASKFFKRSSEEEERYYQYTLKGSMKELKGKTDDTGCSMQPLKIDKYGYIMIAVFVVQIIILALLQ